MTGNCLAGDRSAATTTRGVCFFVSSASFALMHPFSFADRYNASGTYGVDHYAILLDSYNFVTSERFTVVYTRGSADRNSAGSPCGIRLIQVRNFSFDDILL